MQPDEIIELIDNHEKKFYLEKLLSTLGHFDRILIEQAFGLGQPQLSIRQMALRRFSTNIEIKDKISNIISHLIRVSDAYLDAAKGLRNYHNYVNGNIQKRSKVLSRKGKKRQVFLNFKNN